MEGAALDRRAQGAASGGAEAARAGSGALAPGQRRSRASPFAAIAQLAARALARDARAGVERREPAARAVRRGPDWPGDGVDPARGDAHRRRPAGGALARSRLASAGQGAIRSDLAGGTAGADRRADRRSRALDLRARAGAADQGAAQGHSGRRARGARRRRGAAAERCAMSASEPGPAQRQPPSRGATGSASPLLGASSAVPQQRPRSCAGSLVAGLGVVFGAIYLLNPGWGVFELVPDYLPGIGNLDEAGAAAL